MQPIKMLNIRSLFDSIRRMVGSPEVPEDRPEKKKAEGKAQRQLQVKRKLRRRMTRASQKRNRGR